MFQISPNVPNLAPIYFQWIAKMLDDRRPSITEEQCNGLMANKGYH